MHGQQSVATPYPWRVMAVNYRKWGVPFSNTERHDAPTVCQ